MTTDPRLEEIMSEYRFLQILTTPWKSLPAYKYGIIDENGKILKSRKDLKELHEKQAYPDLFYALCWNTKRLLEQFAGKTQDANEFIRSVWNLKNRYGGLNPMKYESHIQDYLSERGHSMDFIKGKMILENENISISSIGEVFGVALYQVDGKILTISELKKVTEDGAAVAAPANNVGGGQMAGVSPGQEPPMPKGSTSMQKRKKIQRRQQDRIQKDIQTLNIIDPKK